MMKRVFLTVAIVVCVISFAAVARAAYHDGDFQIWNTDAQDIKIGKATKFVMEEEYRYGEGASELFYQHYDWGMAWAFDKRFEIAPGFRLIYEKYKHKFREEDVPFVNLTWKQDIWRFRFEDRNRIEYRIYRYPGVENNIRYRNRFALKYPMEFRGIKFIPYSSDEIFISSNGTGFNQNRFESGLELELTKYVKLSASYMFQSIRVTGNKWYTANVLWLKDKIAF
jgi:hypothetical protein